jgi:hypothetical protein
MCIVPEFNHDSILALVYFLERMETEQAKEIKTLGLTGWIIVRKSDGAVYGSTDGYAYHLFINDGIANKVLSTLHDKENWKILHVDTIEKQG